MFVTYEFIDRWTDLVDIYVFIFIIRRWVIRAKKKKIFVLDYIRKNIHKHIEHTVISLYVTCTSETNGGMVEVCSGRWRTDKHSEKEDYCVFCMLYVCRRFTLCILAIRYIDDKTIANFQTIEERQTSNEEDRLCVV